MQLTARYRGAQVDYLDCRGPAREVRRALVEHLAELARLAATGEQPWAIEVTVRDCHGKVRERRVVPGGKR